MDIMDTHLLRLAIVALALQHIRIICSNDATVLKSIINEKLKDNAAVKLFTLRNLEQVKKLRSRRSNSKSSGDAWTKERNKALRRKRAAQSKSSSTLGPFVSDLNPGKAHTFIDFDEWKQWPEMYPMCNPKNNPYLSPVDIDTSTVIPDHHMQTLLVYSGKPARGLYYLTTNTEIAAGMEIEILSITVKSGRHRESTYISGLGENKLRFFERAYFMYTNNSVGPERSLHRINGEEPFAEMVAIFSDPAKTTTTNVHLLIRKGKKLPDNPLFYPVFLAIQRHQMQSAEGEQIKERQKTWNDVLRTRKALKYWKKKQNEDTGGSTYAEVVEDLKHLMKKLSKASRTLRQVPKVKKERVALLKKSNKNIENLTKELNELLNRRVSLIHIVDEKIERGELDRDGSDETTDQLDEVKDQIDDFQSKLKAERNINFKLVSEVERYDRIVEDAHFVMKTNLIGTKPVAMYSSIRDVGKKLREMKQNRLKFEQVEESEILALGDYETYFSIPSRSVFIEVDFQISWLFPFVGGFYTYNGSNCIPPCTPANYTVILENWLNISSNQAERLLSVVKKGQSEILQAYIFNGTDKEVKTLDFRKPIKQYLGNRTVRYNRRNIQFMMDDSVHMISSLRRHLKQQRSSAKVVTVRMLPYIWSLVSPFIWKILIV